MSWSHALLDGKGTSPRGGGERRESQTDGRTDGHVDRRARTRVSRRRGEGRKAERGDKKGSVRRGVRSPRHGARLQRGRSAEQGRALAAPRGDGAHPATPRPPRCWGHHQQ